MEFTGTFSEGISKADDRIIAAVMWSLTVRKYPVYLARMILVAVLWKSMTEPVPTAARDSDTNIGDL